MDRPLTLDHVFVRVDDLDRAAGHLRAAGFTVDFQRDHPGQGTTNRCTLFADSYLELLAIRDASEAAQNPLQLHARRSPLGIALRGPLPDPLGADWWVYDPPYGGGQFVIDIHPGARKDTAVPLVFCMRPAPPPPARRKALRPEHLQHPNGARGIVQIRVEGPVEQPPLTAPWLVRQPVGTTPRLVVVVAGARLDAPVAVGDALLICTDE